MAKWAMPVLLLVAAAVRIREALITPLWFDEIFSLRIARQSLPDMLRAVSHDVHPPLHYLLIWTWRAIGGEGDLWIKSTSLILSVVLIAVMAPFGRALFGAGTGLLAAAFLSVHPIHVVFSQEVRWYMPFWLLIVLCLWTAWQWVEGRRLKHGVLFVLCSTAALYTHYLAVFPLASLGLWGLVALRHDRKGLTAWVGLHLCTAVLFVPQTRILLPQLLTARDHWIKPPSLDDLYRVARWLSLGAHYLVIPMFGLALLPLFRRDQRRGASLLWVATLPTVLATWWLTLRGMHLYAVTYMTFTLPAFCLLVAAGITGLRWKLLRWVGALGLLALGARALILHQPSPEPTGLAHAMAYLRSHAEPGDLVYHADTHSLLFFQHHLPDHGRHLLLWTHPRLPYYEGALVISDSSRVTPDHWQAARDGGRRWWAVRTKHGGMESTSAAKLFDDATAGPVLEEGPVTMWDGQRAKRP